MKKCSKWFLVAMFAFCLGLLPQAQSEAADKVSSIRQTGADRTSVTVEANSVLGASGYCLQLSEDNVNWTTMQKTTSTTIRASSLSSGHSYYARVCLYDANKAEILGSESPAIEVVTAPSATGSGTVKAVQQSATQTGFSAAITGVSGANWCRITYNNQVIGEGSPSNTAINSTLNAGTRYWCDVIACRRSSTGFVATGAYDYIYLKTLSPAINSSNFGASYVSPVSNSASFSASNSGHYTDGFDWQFATPKGKVKRTQSVTTSYSTTCTINVSNFIKGGFYKYRVRTFVNCGTNRVYSDWSPYRTIACPKKISAKLIKKTRAVKVSWSKDNYASKYDILISTKENSGFKKVKTVKSRSITISKCGKKKLKKNTKYYVRIIPKAKIGKKLTKAEVYMIQSFTIGSSIVY